MTDPGEGDPLSPKPAATAGDGAGDGAETGSEAGDEAETGSEAGGGVDAGVGVEKEPPSPSLRWCAPGGGIAPPGAHQRNVVETGAAEHYRPIVSFQPRGGRMNEVQKRAWEAHAAHFLIERDQLDGTGVDQLALFGRIAPLVIEIGPGMGDATAAMAAARPEINLLAIEVYKPGIAQTFAHLARAGVDNVRVLRADAAEVLRNIVIPDSLAELWLFFPDPWRKRKHHKRRIVTAGFADLVASRLQPGGSWYLATDWEHYAHQMLRVVSQCGGLTNPHGGWAPRAEFRPRTRFEKRGLGAEREIFDLHVVRP